MNPTDNSLEQGYEASSYNSSLESGFSSGPNVGKSRGGFSILKFNKTAFMATFVVVAVIGLIGGTALVVKLFQDKSKNNSSLSSNQLNQYSAGSNNLPLEQVNGSDQLELGQVSKLQVNGQLDVSKSIVLSPSSTPSSPVTGQIYYNKSNNAPYFYNGSQFVSLEPTAIPQHVTSLGGAAGVIGLGNGLNISGGNLSIASSLLQTISNAGTTPQKVTSVQGASGAVTLTGGPGISINGTTISNTGVLGLTSDGSITITNNGNNTYNLKVAAGSSAVTTLNGLNGALTLADATTGGSTITINTATSVAPGIAAFNATNLPISGGVVNTAQDISSAASPAFAGLTLGNSSALGTIALEDGTGDGGNNYQTTISQNALSGNQSIAVPGQAGPSSEFVVGAGTNLSLNTNTGVISTTTNPSFTTSVTTPELLSSGNLLIEPNSGNGTVQVTSSNLNLSTSGAATTLALGSVGTNEGELTLDSSSAGGSFVIEAASGAGAFGQTNQTVLTLPVDANATDEICLETVSNCTPSNAVTSPTAGTSGTIPEYFGTGLTIQNSPITDDGTNVNVNNRNLVVGGLSLNPASNELQSTAALNIVSAGTLTVNAGSQQLLLEGSPSSTFAVSAGGFTDKLAFAGPSTANNTVTIPDAGGVICLQSSSNCGFALSGSGVQSVNTFVGALHFNDITGSSNASSIQIQDADTSGNLGLSTYNPTDFSDLAGTVSTVQDIGTTDDVQFGGLTIGAGSAGSNGNITLNGSGELAFATGGGYLQGVNNGGIDGVTGASVIVNGGADTLEFVTDGGNFTYTFPDNGTQNQTICTSVTVCASGMGAAVILDGNNGTSSTAQADSTGYNSIFINKTNTAGNLIELDSSGSPAFTVAGTGGTDIYDGLQLGGTLVANTPTSTLNLGENTQEFDIQGNDSSTINSTDNTSGGSTSVSFDYGTLDASAGAGVNHVNYYFENNGVMAGNYEICTKVGNCGIGNAVTSDGNGLSGIIPEYSSATGLQNSPLTDSGSGTITIKDNLTVGKGGKGGQLNLGDSTTSGSLVFSNTTHSAATVTIQQASTAPTSPVTINLPTAGGTIAVAASGPLSLSSAGVLTCATCLTSGGGGGSAGVSSLNTFTGDLILNDVTAGSTGSSIQIQNGDLSGNFGLASFNPNDFQIETGGSAGVIDTVQGITKTSTPNFTGVQLGSHTTLGKLILQDGTTDGGNNYQTTISQNTLSGNQAIAIPGQAGANSEFVVGASGNLSVTPSTGVVSISDSPSFATSVTTPQLLSGSNLLVQANSGSGTLQVSSSNFNLAINGVLTVKGGTSSDITTSSASSANKITIQPGASSGGVGANLVLDAGSGSLSNNGGTVSIGTSSAAAISIGQSGVTTTINGGLTLGTVGSNEGSLTLASSRAGGSFILQAANGAGANGQTNTTTLTIPVDTNLTDTVCLLTIANCLGGASGGANTQLSNLSASGTSINESLVPNAATGIALGSGTLPFDNEDLAGTLTGLSSATITGFTTVDGATLSGGTVSGGTLTATSVNGLNVSGTAIGSTGALSVSANSGAGTFAVSSSAFNLNTTGGLSLGTVGSQTGQLTLDSSHSSGSFTFKADTGQLNTTSIDVPVDANANDTVCLLTLANCLGGSSGGANTQLSNLSASGTSINESLVPNSATGITLGSAALPFDNAYIAGTLTGESSPTLTGFGTINGATLSGGTLSGSTLSSTALTFSSGTDSISAGASTLQVTSSNFNLATTGTLSLGTVGSQTGQLTLDSSHSSGSFTFKADTGQLNTTSIDVPVDANANDTVCLLTLANCLGGSSGGANTQLSNLSASGTSINESLVPNSATGITLGSAALPFDNAYIAGTLTGESSPTLTGFGTINGATLSGGTLSGSTLSSTALTFSSGTDSISAGASTLQVTSSNFNLATNGQVTLAGGLSPDITTALASAANKITIQPGNSNGNGGTAANLVLQAGNETGTGTTTGGSLTIDAGTGSSAAHNGTISIGTTNASAVNIGSSNAATTVNGVFDQTYSSSSGSNAQNISVSNTNPGVANTVQGISLTPVNNSGSSTNIVDLLNFNSGTLGGTQTTNAINFGSATGYTNFINAPGFLLTSSGALSLGVSGSGGTLVNYGSTLDAVKALGDSGVSTLLGGAGTTAANTVDIYTSFIVTQTTTGKTLTLPSPTVTTGGRIVYVTSSSSSTTSFTLYGATLSPGTTQDLFWNGASWTANGSGTNNNYIQNQASALQTANFDTQVATSGVAGTTDTIEAASGGQTVDILDVLQNNGTTKELAVTNSGVSTAGNLSVTGTINNATISGGTLSGSSLSSTALSFGSASDTISGATSISLDTTGAGTVSLGSVNATTLNIGGSSSVAETINVGGTNSSSKVTLTAGTSGNLQVTTGGDLVQGASATQFVVQSSSSDQILSVNDSTDTVILGTSGVSGVNGSLSFDNNSNSNVLTLIGGVTGAGGLTLTLPTTGASASGKCLQSGTGSSGTSTNLIFNGCGAGNTKVINLTAEYAGAVLDEQNDPNCSTGDDIGTITSGYTGDSSPQNYYLWTSPQSGVQCYDIVVQVPIPNDFNGFNNSPTPPKIYGQESSGAVYMEILSSSGAADTGFCPTGMNKGVNSAAASNVWCNIGFSGTYGYVNLNLPTGTYTAGQTMTIKLEVVSSTTNGQAEVGNISLPYTTAF